MYNSSQVGQYDNEKDERRSDYEEKSMQFEI